VDAQCANSPTAGQQLKNATTKRKLAREGFVRQTGLMKKEFVFQIEQDEAMLVAICHEPEMATQGDNLDELLVMIRDLIRCRFDEGDERLGWPIRTARTETGRMRFFRTN
jgi:hypothetical protein